MKTYSAIMKTYGASDSILSDWQVKAQSENSEDLTSELFNYFLEENDHRDFDAFQSITYSVFMHGLRCVDWDYVYDLLKKS